MTRSIHSSHYLTFLSIILVTGCAQQSPSHITINEIPPTIQSSYHRPPLKNPGEILKQPTDSAIAKKVMKLDTVWDRLVALYALPVYDNERIEQQLLWYLQHPEYIARIQQRAEPYLYFILNEVEAKKIPGEMALLPAIESAFKPNAYSSSQAAGLWQFIPSTGRFFGLKQNWWYDGRRDVIASTRAATRYLKELSEEFENDWLLALASYNAGKGNIHKAINKNNEQDLDTDYWSLDLRQETRNYVPRLLAIAEIFANPEKYNITLHEIPNKPYFEVVNIKSQLDLGKAVEMAQTPIDDFFMLNPGFNRWSTDPDGPHRLLIPVDKANQFKHKLDLLSEKERMKWIRHEIQQGETLGAIAKKHQSSIPAIKTSNHLNSDIIRAGKILMIPVPLQKLAQNSKNAYKITGHFYTVKKGDTFWQIARKFAVSSKDLARWNQIPLNTTLRPGQKLIIKLQDNAAIAAGRALSLRGS